jgi:hypothetical protein
LYAIGKNSNIIKKFSEANTPLTFGNTISYTVGDQKSPIVIENNFYVSEISNLLEKEVYTHYTGEFYVKYNSSRRSPKH